MHTQTHTDEIAELISTFDWHTALVTMQLGKLAALHQKKAKFPTIKILPPLRRHDICQNFYATGVLRSQNLRKKRVNHDNSKFARKQRKCLNFITNFTFFVTVAQIVLHICK